MTEQEIQMWKEDLDMIKMLREKNEELEHIIDELEKWLEKERKRLRKSIKPINEIRVQMIDSIQYKFQELKGSDSNE